MPNSNPPPPVENPSPQVEDEQSTLPFSFLTRFPLQLLPHFIIFSIAGCLIRIYLIKLSPLFSPVVSNVAYMLSQEKLNCLHITPERCDQAVLERVLKLNIYYDLDSYFQLWYTALLPQITGCFLMGLIFEAKVPLKRISPYLPTALSTGLCGSVTSFSGWIISTVALMLDTSHVMSNANISGTMNVLHLILALLLTYSSSVLSFQSGRQLIFILSHVKRRVPFSVLPTLTSTLSRLSYSTLLLHFLALSTVVTLVILSCLPSTSRYLLTLFLSLLLAPIGTTIRYLLASKFNPTIAPTVPLSLSDVHFQYHLRNAIPWGTFAANMAGTLILSVIFLMKSWLLLPSSKPIYSEEIGFVVMQSLADGFCGCLSTVSTFVVEVMSLKKREKELERQCKRYDELNEATVEQETNDIQLGGVRPGERENHEGRREQIVFNEQEQRRGSENVVHGWQLHLLYSWGSIFAGTLIATIIILGGMKGLKVA